MTWDNKLIGTNRSSKADEYRTIRESLGCSRNYALLILALMVVASQFLPYPSLLWLGPIIAIGGVIASNSMQIGEIDRKLMKIDLGQND